MDWLWDRKDERKGAEWRASVFFNTSSQKLAHLNSIMGIVEYQNLNG